MKKIQGMGEKKKSCKILEITVKYRFYSRPVTSVLLSAFGMSGTWLADMQCMGVASSLTRTCLAVEDKTVWKLVLDAQS